MSGGYYSRLLAHSLILPQGRRETVMSKGLLDVIPGAGPSNGTKEDVHKLDWLLLPMESVEEIIKVLEYGAEKYSPENWKKLPDFRRRYINAAMRHLVAYVKGERIDEETGLSHIAHLGCNVLFLLWGEKHGKAN